MLYTLFDCIGCGADAANGWDLRRGDGSIYPGYGSKFT
jgi:hypothetical protein